MSYVREMAEQNFRQAIRIADRGYVLVHGKIAHIANSVDDLQQNQLVKELYLGTKAPAQRASPPAL